jgi:hypothetical protein
VDLSSNQTVGGVKTLSNQPIIGGVKINTASSNIITFNNSNLTLTFPCNQVIPIYTTNTSSTVTLPLITSSNVGSTITLRRVNHNATTATVNVVGASQWVITSSNTTYTTLNFKSQFIALPYVNNSPAVTIKQALIDSTDNTLINFTRITVITGTNSTTTNFVPTAGLNITGSISGTTLTLVSSPGPSIIGTLIGGTGLPNSAVWVVSGSGTSYVVSQSLTVASTSLSFYSSYCKTSGTLDALNTPNATIGDYITTPNWTITLPPVKITAISYTAGRPTFTLSKAITVQTSQQFSFYNAGLAPWENSSSLYAIPTNCLFLPDNTYINIKWSSSGVPSGILTNTAPGGFGPITLTLIDYPLTYAWFEV